MIPSEFNHDVMAQRRKLRSLHEARVSSLYEAPKSPTKDSWLTGAKVGGLWVVFRVFGNSTHAEIVRLPGLHKSIQAANKAAQAIGEKTGEELRKS